MTMNPCLPFSLMPTLLSFTTDGLSAPSLLFDHKPHDEPKANAFSNQLKKLYHNIPHLKTKLLVDLGEPQDENCIVIKSEMDKLD